MTYAELYRKAEWSLDHNEITLGEFNEMIKPLLEEIRPTGRWEYRDVVYVKRCVLNCSNCGHINLSYRTPYCPNCGAKMEAEE